MDWTAGCVHRAILQMLAIPVSIALSIIIIVSATLPRGAEGATASIGGNFYYMAWQPPWSDGTTFMVPQYMAFMGFLSPTVGDLVRWRNSIRIRINDYKPIHGPMAGPSLTVNFAERWSISTVFLAGRFIASSTGPVFRGAADTLSPYLPTGSDPVMLLTTHYRRVIVRYDSDTTAACALNRYVRLFAGFKYQGYQYDESMDYLANNGGGLIAKGNARFHSFGGGLGLGLSLPLAAGLYANLNFSGLCLYGIASYDFDRQYLYIVSGSLFPIPAQFSGERYWSAGGNSTLSLSYLIEPANVTLSLGFRYQALYYFWQANNPKGFLDYYGRLDHSYGGTFSIIYSFGAKKA